MLKRFDTAKTRHPYHRLAGLMDRQQARCFSRSLRLCGLLLFSLMSSSVFAETYVAAQLGVTVPQSLSDVNLMSPKDTTLTDLDLKTSLIYGGKLGHYVEGVKWLGVETEIFRSTPQVSQQPVTTTSVATGSTSLEVEPGASLTITTWALNVMLRYPGARLQPYVGVGPGLFFARLSSDSPASRFGEAQATNLGLNTQVGLRYLFKTQVSVFAEWKYNHVRLSFDSIPNATYNAHHIVFGLGYHFK
jgi:opacity protein-like surface antigen